MPKVAISIIIPVSNNLEYFNECICSVLRQTLKNIEIIVIDDCSSDANYLNIISQFQDRRFKFIRNDKQIGSGMSRNKGMACAEGEYIAFLDADDFYPNSTSLEVLYNTALSNELNICGGSLFIVDGQSKVVNKKFPGQYFNKPGIVFYADYQHDGGFYRFIYKRTFLLDNNLSFPDFKRMQDPVFFVKSMLAAGCFFAVNMYVYAYRKNHKQLIWDHIKIVDHYAAIKQILKLSKKNKLAHLHYLMVKNFYHFSTINLGNVKGIFKRFRIVYSTIKLIDFELLNKKWPNDTESFGVVKIFSVLLLSFFGSKENL